jgi:colanic acid/amylovoran biosynthesis glycosyltransferase
MRIAFFLDKFPAPSQPFILNQIIGMIDRGHDVDIYATHRFQGSMMHPQVLAYGLLEKARFFSDMPTRYLDRLILIVKLICVRGLWRRPLLILRSLLTSSNGQSGLNLRLLYRALTVTDRAPYDIIHCQFGKLGPMALELRQLKAISGRIVTSIRGYDITQLLKLNPDYYDELFQSGDMFLPVSNSLKEKLLSAGCPADRIRVLHSGIDCGRFNYTERHKTPGDVTRLAGIGRLVAKKGWSDAIQALANARALGRNICLTIAGDGPLRQQLEQLVNSLDLQDSVKLLGWCNQDEIIRLLEESHILVAPSITTHDGDQEGIPNVLKEAMAMGLPVISTWHSGIPELVNHGKTGYLVPERDVASLTQCLIELSDHPESWAKISKDARNIIEAEYEMEKINNTLVDIYQNLTRNHAR